jgi:hypothetical protein
LWKNLIFFLLRALREKGLPRIEIIDFNGRLNKITHRSATGYGHLGKRSRILSGV